MRAEGVHCDVAERASLEDAARATVAAFGKVHVVCNNAGVGAGGLIGSVKPKDWDWIVAVNLSGVMYAVSAVLPGMRTAGDGLVVIVSSWVGRHAVKLGGPAYNATKHGLVALGH